VVAAGGEILADDAPGRPVNPALQAVDIRPDD
jgi:hypothetical protein